MGRLDLVVLRHGGNVVLRGLGDCRFEPANDRFGLDGGTSWTTAFHATWEGSNALPTLAFGNYLVPGTHDQCDDKLVRPARETATPLPCRWRPATARCRCCSATGAGPASTICA